MKAISKGSEFFLKHSTKGRWATEDKSSVRAAKKDRPSSSQVPIPLKIASAVFSG